jgi:hypothetical protein
MVLGCWSLRTASQRDCPHGNRDTLIDDWNGTIEYNEDAINAIKPIGAGSI